ncbi:carbamoyltransferase family protein [Pinibacter aurantiacus]|uniref:Carbamoyltransferase n=1 Tax=Pinibacter aurantiacus TaxID=2851599 RepID=A0A9E2W335_9BACT|nr:carbamoyltransferase C-terminal domain-containing protein [Pinibacter aurantiacus]MBV4358065.1 carbamoyltransferase [Pinibacter aurantiacus]
MIILGINAHHADSSAAIFVDGKMIAAIEEERFRRVKHWAGFPSLAIEFCLKEARLLMEQVDFIAIGRDPKSKLFQKLLFWSCHPLASLSYIQKRIFNSRQISSGLVEDLCSLSGIRTEIIEHKLRQVEHHRSHLSSAFFASPFDEAAILSLDGSGDFTTTMTAIGKGNKIEVLDSINFPHSIGIFYTAFTQLLGFPHYGDEYKVMGLAPYGDPGLTNKVKELIQWPEEGRFRLDLSYLRSPAKGYAFYENNIPIVPSLFSKKMEAVFGKARQEGEPLTQYHMDLAASVQKATEETVFKLLTFLHTKTGYDKVCIAGGVAQNSVLNGKITRNTPFKQVYIPPAGHDAGISMGAALYVQHHLEGLKRQEPIHSAYTGSYFSDDVIEKLLKEKGVGYTKTECDKRYATVTECLINGGVVGWFNGRAEFGPRALGGRSILVDPRRGDAKEILNKKIKRRESFRPFAPSILKEYVDEYFEVNDTVPFMEKVFPIRKNKQATVPAVTHVDGTGRLQTVDKLISPDYYKLIDCFRIKTGVPILLNTSFNENEPIVNSPEEALNCFLRTEMDMLVLENFIVHR